MNPVSVLIVISLAVNVLLAMQMRGAANRIKESRQLSLLEDTDLNRVRDLSGRIKAASGLNTQALSQDLYLLQKIKFAVAQQVHSPRSGRPDIRCPRASKAELNQLITQMADYKKRVDIFLRSSGTTSAEKEKMIRAVEDEAQKIKLELIAQCAR